MHVDRTSAGELLRRARTSAGLTQVELANRLGMQQSVISAYESGHRQPVLPTLAAMIDATGYHLHVDVRPGRLSRKLGGPLGKRVLRHRHRLIKAAARYGAANLGIFGSVARGVERPDSDIDVLVDLSPESGLLTLMRLEHDFEGILGTSVDVVPSDSVKAGLRQDIEQDLVPL